MSLQFTAGPLVIQSNDKVKGIWLKSPARTGGAAIATVWHTPNRDVAKDNAVLMAHACELWTMACMLAAAKSTEEAVSVKRYAKDLLQRIEEAANA